MEKLIDPVDEFTESSGESTETFLEMLVSIKKLNTRSNGSNAQVGVRAHYSYEK